MYRFIVLSCMAVTATLSACSTTRQAAPDTSIKTSSVIAPEERKLAYAGDDATPRLAGPHHLAGRILEVSSLADLKLQDKEVILSFDDGPIPGRTDKVLAILDQFGVKGAFMMVGEMAERHPALARKVAQDGNTIGSHTYDHANLSSLSFDAAMAEVIKGELAVTKATGTDVSFFRFPYLAESHRLRAAIAMRDMVVMDVDIDSKDYFTATRVSAMQRTMNLLHKRGRGIILMHDIHKRTATMLPTLLSRLEAEGYKVVTLKFKKTEVPNTVVASADLVTIR
ncbi:polysaccharide deacetylase family protein [Rhizobium ruizarguesonis]|jgi:peptidoglycan/xylan/chitin deacetylase (PgdA/CDA1 family)|uniref:Chitooligosaccharide deacetylase n=1 Tax=Rhizobium ruizarguesonis TaxID=2081791 RepID=A0AAE5C1W2_9HYPH|nr:polysaccharide deacetylase family protein [Rhizobium ruizarguesonis]MBY5803525.1 polysaccharide deacetylase family protein [Rhizobium leguminosarum]NKL11609.1 polysaccharide deacetylase family protein [Rhizobium leguminosarum bv. viciae]QIO44148.1 polysaccharide deacetylase family protein [Rhizobium leguminosarum bv. trifolii]MBY5844397.1 polysaccharide deacetylase family protein [Rhizobium leguminosarum]MBY5883454.1 polysaccharide deacetylase family protein [Rhizobium leguminosarum]